MKNHQKLYQFIFIFISCLLLCFLIGQQNLSVQAVKTTTKQTSLTKLNTIIAENEAEINTLIEAQKELNTKCSEAISNALENNLLVNEKDSKSLEKLSSNMEKQTAKLKTAKTQQEEIQEELDAMTDTKSSKYRKNKCKIITLQNRQFKLISQINKNIEKIIKLCTVSTVDTTTN